MRAAQTFLVERMNTPIGVMLVVTDREGALRAVDWHDHEGLMHALLRRQYPTMATSVVPHPSRSGAARALEAYFEGDMQATDGLAVATGGTGFQNRVWSALRDIPAGETISYGRLAARIGSPTAARAVGYANGCNLVDIVVPCHRVIGANRSLTGYGGGMERKAWLLDHERERGGGFRSVTEKP